LRKGAIAVLAMGSGISESRTALGPHEVEVGRSTCQGDSGGPAISEETNAVVGVVSRGGGCDRDFGHGHTTTTGFTALCDEASAIAGGAPIVEVGRSAPPPPAPREAPIASPLADAPAGAEGCAVGSRAGHGGTYGGAGVVCALGLTLLAR